MKLEQLNEGIRFGGPERRLLSKASRDIRIGIEYEFHPDEDVLALSTSTGVAEDTDVGEEWIYDRALELTEKSIQNDIEVKRSDYVTVSVSDSLIEEVNRIVVNIREWYGTVDIVSDMRDLSEVIELAERIEAEEELSEEETVTFNEQAALITALVGRFDGLYLMVDELYLHRDELDANQYTVSGLDNISDDLEAFHDSVTDMNKIEKVDAATIVDIDPTLFDDIEDSLGLFTDTYKSNEEMDRELEKYFENNFDENLEEFLEYDPQNVVEHSSWDDNCGEASNEWHAENSPTDTVDMVEVIANLLEDEVDHSKIETVEEENSTTVEVITRPLSLDETFEFMEEMMKFIESHGSTSEGTGMHVNMSMKGQSFDKGHFNQMKLLMLADHSFMQSIGKYPPRQHVAKMFANINPKHVVMLAGTYVKSGIDVVATELERLGNIRTKHQAINFGGVSHSVESFRRIEFRYFGGDGYESDYDDMKEDIEQAAWALMVSYSPTFANREYYKALLKQLDILTKRHIHIKGVQSFIGLSQKLESGKIQLSDILSDREINNINSEGDVLQQILDDFS